jgi:hypothetical protein
LGQFRSYLLACPFIDPRQGEFVPAASEVIEDWLVAVLESQPGLTGVVQHDAAVCVEQWLLHIRRQGIGDDFVCLVLDHVLGVELLVMLMHHIGSVRVAMNDGAVRITNGYAAMFASRVAAGLSVIFPLDLDNMSGMCVWSPCLDLQHCHRSVSPAGVERSSYAFFVCPAAANHRISKKNIHKLTRYRDNSLMFHSFQEMEITTEDFSLFGCYKKFTACWHIVRLRRAPCAGGA